VIKIDVGFAEAYNRRATVHFGLRREDECFADIEMVLKLEPMHYGALCGKVSGSVGQWVSGSVGQWVNGFRNI
jgi:hypothetical protein